MQACAPEKKTPGGYKAIVLLGRARAAKPPSSSPVSNAHVDAAPNSLCMQLVDATLDHDFRPSRRGTNSRYNAGRPTGRATARAHLLFLL